MPRRNAPPRRRKSRAAAPQPVNDRIAELRSALPEQERRMIACEVRAVRDERGDVRGLEGFSARFNERTYIGPEGRGFYEEIAPGAFRDAIAANDTVCLFNHSADNVLGRRSAGTLRLEEQGTEGLWADNDLPPTSLGRDMAVLVDRRDIIGQSFSFTVAEDRWSQMPDGEALRTIVRVGKLWDVGPVTFPAYPTTTVDARSTSMRTAMRGQRDSGDETETRDGVADLGLASMAQATDAAIDAAAAALAEGNPAQAVCLLTAASLCIDEACWALYWGIDPALLEALGLGDLPDLIQVVDSAIDAALSACEVGAAGTTAMDAALAASDALLAALRLPDADDPATETEGDAQNDNDATNEDRPRSAVTETERRLRWHSAAAAVLAE